MESYKEIMSNHSDKKLIEILSNRDKYQDIAIEAATDEAIKRKIIENKTDLETKYPINSIQSNFDESSGYDIKKEKAKNDMLYGALWCIGGIVLTLAHIGFIFWGAILFGGIQFFRGLYNSK